MKVCVKNTKDESIVVPRDRVMGQFSVIEKSAAVCTLDVFKELRERESVSAVKDGQESNLFQEKDKDFSESVSVVKDSQESNVFQEKEKDFSESFSAVKDSQENNVFQGKEKDFSDSFSAVKDSQESNVFQEKDKDLSEDEVTIPHHEEYFQNKVTKRIQRGYNWEETKQPEKLNQEVH